METINVINVGGVDKEIEDTVARGSNTTQSSQIQTLTSNLATTNTNLSSEVSERTSEDALINARIDEIIAPGGEAPSAAEVTDARVGADGTIYATLGNAIREQNNALMVTNDNFAEYVANGDIPIFANWQRGNINTTDGTINSSYNSRVCNSNALHWNRDVKLKCKAGYKMIVSSYLSDDTYVSSSGIVSEYNVWAGVTNNYVRITIRKDPEPPTLPLSVYEFASQIYMQSDHDLDIQKKLTTNATNILVHENAINNIYDDLLNVSRTENFLQLRQGAWLNDGTYDGQTRIVHATVVYIPNGKCELVFDDSVYDTYVRYVADRNFTAIVESHGWYTTSPQTLTLPVGGRYLAINVRKKDNTLLAPTDINNDDLKLNIIQYAPSYLDEIAKPVITHNFYSVAHRGLSADYPENTMPAFIAAYDHNLNVIETDIQYTSDGIPVLMHDQTINRTGRNSDGTPIATPLEVGNLTYSQLLTYDFGVYKGAKFAGTKICTLDEFLLFCHRLGVRAMLEITPNQSWNDARLSDFISHITKYNMLNNSEIHSYTYLTLLKIVRLVPSIAVCITADNIYPELLNRIKSLDTNKNRVGVVGSVNVYTDSAFVDSLWALNYMLFAAVADSSADLLAMPESCTGILTNGLNIVNEFKNYYGVIS